MIPPAVKRPPAMATGRHPNLAVNTPARGPGIC